MEIRVEQHGRHIVMVTIDNQRRLNAMTRPISAANAASTSRPVNSRSIACTWPTCCASFTVAPPNG